MVSRAYFARRFLALKLLRSALAVGALYDAGLAGLLVGRPPAAARLLGPAVAEPSLLSLLAGLWLAMLAGLALAAAGDIRRHSAVVATILAGRALAALVLVLPATSATPWLAAVNGLLALTLAAAWWPLRR